MNLHTLADLWLEPKMLAPIVWTVQDIIPSDGLVMLYGAPKSGKSTLASQLALAVSRGEPFLEFATTPRDVLWLNLERSTRLMFHRFRAVGLTEKDVANKRLFTYTGPWPKDALGAFKDVLSQFVTTPPFVVIDSLGPFLSLDDENSNAEIIRRLSPIADYIHQHDVPTKVLFHDRKSEGSFGRAVRGGGAFLSVVDAAMHLRRDRDAADADARKLETVANYDEIPLLLKLRYHNKQYVLGSSLDVVLQKVQDALPGNGGGLTLTELAQMTGYSRKRVERKIDLLLERGHASEVEGAYPARFSQ